MKESRRSSQAGDIRAPERRYAAFLPQRGRQRGGGFAAQKGSRPRLATLGSPFQGKGLAWTLPPSYGRRCPAGAEVGWGKRDKKEREDRLKCVVCESSAIPISSERIHACVEKQYPRQSLPQGGRLRRYENAAFLALSERIHAYVKKRITTDKAFPAWGRCPEGADRVLAV